MFVVLKGDGFVVSFTLGIFLDSASHDVHEVIRILLIREVLGRDDGARN